MIEKASMLTAREHLTSAVLDGKLYVIGGRTAGIAANVEANEVYNPITDKLSILASVPSKGRDWLVQSSMKLSTYLVAKDQVVHFTITKNMILR